MKTSYFAKYRGIDGVCVAIKAPPGFKGDHYPDLAPKRHIFLEYKKTGHTRKYIRDYKAEVLDVLDPQKVYDDLENKILLCWEGPNKFCHRRLIAQWIQDKLGVAVPEVE